LITDCKQVKANEHEQQYITNCSFMFLRTRLLYTYKFGFMNQTHLDF